MSKINFFQLFFTLVIIFQIVSVKAQLGLVVDKNDNGSSIKYALETGSDVKEAIANAVIKLEAEDAKNIFKLRSYEETGHQLHEGYYVLILASRKNGGRFFLSYGLGASKVSAQDAEKKAVIHLKEWDLGYKNDFGYSIEKEGKIEDLFTEEKE